MSARLRKMRSGAAAVSLSLLFSLFAGAEAFGADTPSAAPPTEVRTSDAVFKALEQRNIDLDKRAEQLDLKEQRLRIIEQEIGDMLKKYTNIQEEILKREKERQQGQEEQIARLVKMYENMPAEDAAIRMEQMEGTLALNLLAKIKEKKAAQILSGMSPTKAAKFSEKLAREPLERP